MSLYFDYLIVYIEKPRDSTDKLLEQIGEFNKFSGYGINNFKIEVLEECDPEERFERETYYIIALNTLAPNGYNLVFEIVSEWNNFHNVNTWVQWDEDIFW